MSSAAGNVGAGQGYDLAFFFGAFAAKQAAEVQPALSGGWDLRRHEHDCRGIVFGMERETGSFPNTTPRVALGTTIRCWVATFLFGNSGLVECPNKKAAVVLLSGLPAQGVGSFFCEPNPQSVAINVCSFNCFSCRNTAARYGGIRQGHFHLFCSPECLAIKLDAATHVSSAGVFLGLSCHAKILLSNNIRAMPADRNPFVGPSDI